jgi:hypothetical protein
MSDLLPYLMASNVVQLFPLFNILEPLISFVVIKQRTVVFYSYPVHLATQLKFECVRSRLVYRYLLCLKHSVPDQIFVVMSNRKHSCRVPTGICLHWLSLCSFSPRLVLSMIFSLPFRARIFSARMKLC